MTGWAWYHGGINGRAAVPHVDREHDVAVAGTVPSREDQVPPAQFPPYVRGAVPVDQAAPAAPRAASQGSA